MQPKSPGWEGFLLAFAIIFTVLFGLTYVVAEIFLVPIPWLVIALIAAVIAYGLRFVGRPTRR